VSERIKSMSLKELRKLVRELFKHYGRDEVYKDEFFEYFRNKGFKDEEIKILWVKVIGKSGLVRLSFHIIADELPPKEIKSKAFIKLIR